MDSQKPVTPLRVQRIRSHKQPAPANGLPVKYVGRPGVWGNPFQLVGDMIYMNVAHRFADNPWIFLCMGTAKDCIQFYRMVVTGVMNSDCNYYELLRDNMNDLLYWVEHFSKLDLTDLADKNLSCWCALNCQCHADVLLELANEPEVLLPSIIVKMNATGEYFKVAYNIYNSIERVSFTKKIEEATLFQKDAHIIQSPTGQLLKIGLIRCREFNLFLHHQRGIKTDISVIEVLAPEQPLLLKQEKDWNQESYKGFKLLKKHKLI